MALLGSIATVGGYTMVSRVLGFVRDVLIAAILGAGPVADAFFVAFKLPNFFRRLSAEGAFSAAFVPMFAGILAAEGLEAAKRFAERSLSVMLLALLVFVAGMEIVMPSAMAVFAPGFVSRPETYDLAVGLTRITFPYLLLVSLVALYGGVLNALDRFAAMAAAPILLNIFAIAALIFLTPHVETAGHALAWAVVASGGAQLLFLVISAARAGVSLKLPVPRLTPRVRRMLRLMLPAALGAGVVQINMLVDVILASLLPEGSVSYLYFADRVNQLPLGVVGVAVGTALLPLISRQIRLGDEGGAVHSQNRALEFALTLTLPAACGLAVLAQPIVVVLFERGAFDPAAAAATSAALAAYAAGLPAYVMIKVFSPGFFARHDTTTPVKVAIGAMVVNLALNLALMPILAHVGIALATALSSWLNVGVLVMILRRRGYYRLDDGARRRLPRLLLAALLMSAVLVPVSLVAGPVPAHAALGALVLAAMIGLGVVVFGGFALVMGGVDRAMLQRALTRRRKPPAER